MTAKLDDIDTLRYEDVFSHECPDADVSFYDISGGLDEYLAANGRGFGTPDPRETIEEELKFKDSAIYVLRCKDSIASSVTVWKHNKNTVATENIFTVPVYRGKGFAGFLLLTALKDAYAKGYRRARLTVYEDDVQAIDLYKKLGYKPTKTLWEMHHE